MTRLVLAPGPPRPEDLQRISEALSGERVAVLPTDTIYGLHALARSEKGVARIAALKHRDEGKPLLILAASMAQLTAIGVLLSAATSEFLSSVWPAPLTAILPIAKPLAATRGRVTAGIRIPALAWLRGLIEVTGPLASTSVNLSGESPVYTMENLTPEIEDQVEIVVDIGILRGEPSTVVDFTTDPPEVIREGGFNFTQKLWKSSRKSL